MGMSLGYAAQGRITDRFRRQATPPQKGQRSCIFEQLWANARLFVFFHWEIA